MKNTILFLFISIPVVLKRIFVLLIMLTYLAQSIFKLVILRALIIRMTFVFFKLLVNFNTEINLICFATITEFYSPDILTSYIQFSIILF